MTRFLRAALSALLPAIACVSASVAADAPLEAVAKVDLDRYAGRWHEIARYPNFFERNCLRDVTAEYARLDDGRLSVINECRAADGGQQRAEGVARVVGPAQLEVRFAPAFLSFLPFVWGDYWVIDLAPDYSYAVVGEPSREYLWILARSPAMNDATYREIIARLPAAGYDPARVLRNPQ